MWRSAGRSHSGAQEEYQVGVLRQLAHRFEIIRIYAVPLTLPKRRKKHHQNLRQPREKPTSLTLIGFSIFTFMPKEKAALVIIKTRLLDPALGEWPSRRRTRRAVRPSSFLHLLKVTGTIYRNRGASVDVDPL